MLKRLSLLLWLALLASPLAAATQTEYASALQGWQRTLAGFVDDQGRTDFVALARAQEDLRRYVDIIGAFSPASNPEAFPDQQAVLAFHINSYNALAMFGVIDEGIPGGFNSFFKRAGFFRFRSVLIGGKKTNLYDYENKVIRPLQEPRVHFVLNCMVRDCPRLPREVFTAERLDAQLEAATREFLNSEKHLRVDHQQRSIHVSAILDFYTRDFVASGKAIDLPSYINRYRDTPLPADYKVRFLKYDWTINQQPSR